MNAQTNQFQESVVSHPPATDTAAARSGLVPAEQCGGQVLDAPFHAAFEIVINLPMPPSTNNLFASARNMRYRTPEYNSWIKEAGWQIAIQKPPQTQGRVSLTIEVEEPNTARAMDLANREKATTDLLVKHRIIEGDDQRYVRELNMRWADIQGVRVTIRPLASVSG